MVGVNGWWPFNAIPAPTAGVWSGVAYAVIIKHLVGETPNGVAPQWRKRERVR